MPKAKPVNKEIPQQVLEDKFMRELRRAFPDVDGRTLRGEANRLSKWPANQIQERLDYLYGERIIEIRNEDGEVEGVRRERGPLVQGDTLPTQGQGQGRGSGLRRNDLPSVQTDRPPKTLS